MKTNAAALGRVDEERILSGMIELMCQFARFGNGGSRFSTETLVGGSTTSRSNVYSLTLGSMVVLSACSTSHIMTSIEDSGKLEFLSAWRDTHGLNFPQ